MTAIVERMVSTGFGAYLSVFGAFLAGLALLLLAKRVPMHLGLRAQGQIVGYHERLRQRVSAVPQYMPLVRFQPRGGPPVQFQSRMSADPKRWPEGTLLPIAYRAERPEQAEIASTTRLWLAPAATFLFGAGLCALAWKVAG